VRNIKLTIAYDGTDYSGWQAQWVAGVRQTGTRTVQGELEAALEKVHKRPVKALGAGRTDAGVHARGQVANFYTDIESMAAARFIPALNGHLPLDIRVMAAAEAPETFHARFDATARSYRYRIIPGRQAFPEERRYALQLWRTPDIAMLNDLAGLLRGEMDCSLFASPRDTSRSRTRFIHSASFFMKDSLLCFEITANAFLWRMVRSIVGSLLYYEERALPRSTIAALIANGDHKQAGPTAPPHGLTLWSVKYNLS
jgi:tRNA pseudouridine38-40 synthase